MNTAEAETFSSLLPIFVLVYIFGHGKNVTCVDEGVQALRNRLPLLGVWQCACVGSWLMCGVVVHIFLSEPSLSTECPACLQVETECTEGLSC